MTNFVPLDSGIYIRRLNTNFRYQGEMFTIPIAKSKVIRLDKPEIESALNPPGWLAAAPVGPPPPRLT